MADQLFDYPDPPLPEEPPAGLGADALRTWRQKRELEHGVHPATKLMLLEHDSAIEEKAPTCGDCAERWVKRSRSFEGSKCEAARGVGNDGPDIRQWWPACILWRPV